MSAHTAVVLVLATTSKTPFYIAGGVLAAWAVIVSMIGISRPDFPGSGAARLGVMGISVVLVAAAIGTAVATSTFEHTEAAKAAPKGAPPPPAAAVNGPGSTVNIEADPTGNLRYLQKTVTASSSKVTIVFTNKSPVPHNVTVVQGTAPRGATKTLASGKAQLQLTLKPGTYTFFCSVDGHRAAGMQGTLVVK